MTGFGPSRNLTRRTKPPARPERSGAPDRSVVEKAREDARGPPLAQAPRGGVHVRDREGPPAPAGLPAAGAMPQLIVHEEDLAGRRGQGNFAFVGTFAKHDFARDDPPQRRRQPAAMAGVEHLQAPTVERRVVST